MEPAPEGLYGPRAATGPNNFPKPHFSIIGGRIAISVHHSCLLELAAQSAGNIYTASTVVLTEQEE